MKGNRFLYLVIITFATIMIWVALDIIHANRQVQIPEEVKKLIEPINPRIDEDALKLL